MGQRPSGCARWRHAAYPARTPCRVRGGETVWREAVRPAFVTLDVRLHTSRSAVNIARLSFPRDYPAGTSPYPLSSTGSAFITLAIAHTAHLAA